MNEQEFRQRYGDAMMTLIIPGATEAQQVEAVDFLASTAPRATIAALGVIAKSVGERLTQKQIDTLRLGMVNSIRFEQAGELP